MSHAARVRAPAGAAAGRPAAAPRARRPAATPMRTAGGAPNTSQMLVFVPPHPLLQHWLSVARASATPPALFRAALAELGRLLVYEAVRDWLPVASGEVETPAGDAAPAECVDTSQPLHLLPTLRAGAVLLETAGSLLPGGITHAALVSAAPTGGAGGSTDDGPAARLLPWPRPAAGLPPRLPPGARVLIADPVLATGGAVCACVEAALAAGASPGDVRVVAALAAQPALKLLAERYPGLRVYCAMIDAEVDAQGQARPGLGDADARCFGTPSRFA